MRGSVQYLLFRICHAAIGIHQLVNHVLSYKGFCGQILDDYVLDAADALSSDTYINSGYVSFERSFQLIDDFGKAKYCLVNVENYTLAYARGGIFFDNSKNGDASI